MYSHLYAGPQPAHPVDAFVCKQAENVCRRPGPKLYVREFLLVSGCAHPHHRVVKYLGLLALANIMKHHPKAVAEHRDLVLRCLEDEDVTIRLRALDLLEGEL